MIRIMYMPIYSKGKEGLYRGEPYLIDHIHISNYEIRVHLIGIEGSLSTDEINCPPTILDFNKGRK